MRLITGHRPLSPMRTRVIAILLIAASAVGYGIHYAVFRDSHHIFLYLIGDIAFLPIEVLLVTIVIDRMLSAREARERRYKMNMVIGAFYSEVGHRLLELMGGMTSDRDAIGENAGVAPSWGDARIRKAIEWTHGRKFAVAATRAQFLDLQAHLAEKREFMVRLLENPMLLEHESFTDLLWAVFHLEDELSYREDVEACPDADLAHLCADAERAYTALITQWLEYMIHLRSDYPFLFSLAARMNPLRPGARAEIG
ncbi:MAG: hypothetical protein KBC96_08480 [Armatimonadetes bacterium]|nr:hypothetical protein [Armatimonadota bacterium]